jgi:hypothetical protein
LSSLQENEALTEAPSNVPAKAAPRPNWAVAITSFLFILLQSFCTFAMAVSGVRVVIGVGALAGAIGLIRPLTWFHHDLYRIPMMVIALGGSVLNLYFIWRIRNLRARPASQWRMTPVAPKQIRSENFQVTLSIITLVLIAAEEIGHIIFHGL